ncbi:MAG: AAA domain-containing protein [Bacillus sp. (in: firmicutes)]
MAKTSLEYLKAWQEALRAEIAHLKHGGGNRYLILNGQLISSGEEYTYYFQTRQVVSIPNGSTVKLHWGSMETEAVLLSSEGKGVIISASLSLGTVLSEAFLLYEPWQLLDELSTRMDEIKKSKRKRLRIKKLIEPEKVSKHPQKHYDSAVKELFVRSAHNQATFVWGPPGTGKTYTLARVAANKYLKDKKVLILAQSNAAVDVLMVEVSRFLLKAKKFKEGDIIRFGKSVEPDSEHYAMTMDYLVHQNDPSLLKEKATLQEERQKLRGDLASSFSKRDSQDLLELERKLTALMEKTRKKEKSILKEGRLIGTTLAKAATSPSIYEESYDLVIIDEASMCYIPQAAFAASLAKRAIICGDFKQLPPIAQSKSVSVQEWLREDIFHKAGVVASLGDRLHPLLFLLNEQRRMHPDISSFTNEHIYHSLVHDHPSVMKSRAGIAACNPFPGKASVLIDTSHTGEYCLTGRLSKSRWNPWQLFISFQLLHEARQAGSTSIGYVTPYRLQANLMDLLLDEFYPTEKAAGEIMAATVHRFQGSEREMIIFDSADSFPESRPGYLLIGKESERLINVAVTRTKGKFLHVSDRSYLCGRTNQNHTIRKLLEHQTDQGQIINHQQIGNWIKNQHNNVRWIHAKQTGYLYKDLDRAAHSIIVSVPDHSLLPEQLSNYLERSRSRIEVTILAGGETSFPFIIIDKKCLWLNQPFESVSSCMPPSVAIRLLSPAFIEEFLSQLPISGD